MLSTVVTCSAQALLTLLYQHKQLTHGSELLLHYIMHSRGKGAAEGSLQLDEEKKYWFKIQLAALGNIKAQGKPWCCLEQVEMLCFPNNQSFKSISGLKSATSPGWEVTSEAGITLSDVWQRRSMEIHTCMLCHPAGCLWQDTFLPVKFFLQNWQKDTVNSSGWIYDSYIDT